MTNMPIIAQRRSKNLKSAMRLIGSGSDDDRQKDDFYSTPRSAVDDLLAVETFNGAVWEPACGDGAISKVFAEAGHEVISTDLVDRGYGQHGVDFLMEWQPRAPNIVTNPPFKLGTQFVTKALQLTTGKVAMLLKVPFLEGVERAPVFDGAPFARLWVFRRRQTFLKGGVKPVQMNGYGGMICYGWFVWEHGHKGRASIGWLPQTPDSLASYDLALQEMRNR